MRALRPLLLLALLSGCVFPGFGEEPVAPAAIEDEGWPPPPADDEPAPEPAPSDPSSVPAAPEPSAQAPPPAAPEPPKLADAVLLRWAGENVTSSQRIPIAVPRAGERLEVVLRWRNVGADPGLRLEDEGGRVLAWGVNLTVAARAELDRTSVGTVVAVVDVPSRVLSYEGAARLVPMPSGQGGDLLPDLVNLPPTDIAVETVLEDPIDGPAGPLPDITGTGVFRGCSALEKGYQRAMRCLRFSNAVGNAGAGPLEVRLSPENGAGALATTGGAFVQRIYRGDGTSFEVAGGAAEFHPGHAHWHNAAANEYRLFRYDDVSGLRGDQVGTGKKAGICFMDVGIVAVDAPQVWAPRYVDAMPCFAPHEQQAWYMGIQPGWYDMYPSDLEDQYVELGAAQDGAYLLCARVNQDGALRESDASNNEGCAAFRLTGDKVQELAPPPYHAWS